MQPALRVDISTQRQIAEETRREWRTRRESVDARNFLNQNGSIPWDRSLLVSVVYEAYRLKLASGESIDDEAYVREFPEVGESLRHLIAAGHLVRDGLSEDVGDDDAWPAPGEVFADFLLEKELGKGAFARAYLALEGSMSDRPVVVKIAREVGEEAATLAQLRHTNIVPVHSIKRNDLSGFTALCMPFYGCATLHDVVQTLFASNQNPTAARGVLDAVEELNADQPAVAVAKDPEPILYTGRYEDAVLWIGAELCDALAYAHSQGVYHGDMKPTNVLIDGNGHPLVFDFNLARTDEDTGGVGGTLAYMAPEHLVLLCDEESAEALPVSASSVDVFSLGATLYEAMCGRRPFDLNGPSADRNPADTLLKLQRQGPRSLTDRRGSVDPTVAAAIESCLSFNPTDRPASADEFGQTLRRLLSPTRRLQRRLHRHPRIVTGSLTAACLLVLIVSIWLAVRPSYSARQYLASVAAYESGDYEAAIDLAGITIEADPIHVAALELRAQARLLIAEGMYHSGRSEDAQAEYALAFESLTTADRVAGPRGPRDECRGYIAHRRSELRRAGAFYQSAIDRGHDTAEVRNNLSRIELNENHLGAARQHLDLAIKLKPDLQVARFNRAAVEMTESMQQDRPVTPQAIEDVEAAVSAGNLSVDVCIMAARVHTRAEKPNISAVIRHLKGAAECGLSLRDFDPAELVPYAIDSMQFRNEIETDTRFQVLRTLSPGRKLCERVETILSPSSIAEGSLARPGQ